MSTNERLAMISLFVVAVAIASMIVYRITTIYFL
jgi:hypothetical protein